MKTKNINSTPYSPEDMNNQISNWTRLFPEQIQKANHITVDTRDFKCLIDQDPIKDPMIYSEKHLIPESDIAGWLQSLEKMTGGVKSWRLLQVKLPEFKGWLKYIRFFRSKSEPDKFIVCGRNGELISWRLISKDTITQSNIE